METPVKRTNKKGAGRPKIHNEPTTRFTMIIPTRMKDQVAQVIKAMIRPVKS